MQTVTRLVMFALVAAGTAGLAWAVRYREPVTPPAGVFPDRVDLGPQPFGTTAVGRFRIENRGGSTLSLDRFASSCSCAGVEIDEGGIAKRVEELHVPPGQHADLGVRVAIGARPGTPQAVHVSLRTNDPAQPEKVIVVFSPRVIGGLYTEPEAVVFGDVPVGRPSSQMVRLYANAGGGTVREVRSLYPDQFAVRFHPPAGTEPEHPTAGRFLGMVEVTARTDRPVKLEGSIQVVVGEQAKAQDSIPVHGMVVPAVVAQPSALVLPRHANGQRVWSGRVTLTSRDGVELSVAVEAVPDGLTATVRADTDAPGQWLLDVTARPGATARRDALIRLRAELKPGGTVSAEVPVALSPVDP